MQPAQAPASRPSLSVIDGVAMMVGIVVGIGIFKTPQLVALNVESETAYLLAWLAGGFITLIGALVYAELASAHPDAGGEYHFLSRAFGKRVGLLFAWARLTVIQTGAIAVVAFVFGDYAQQVLPLGAWGPSVYGVAAVVLFTALNLTGTTQGKFTQIIFTSLTVAAIIFVAALGIAQGTSVQTTVMASQDPSSPALGLAMVMILLTYGGWNETAYLSSDVKNPSRNMWRLLAAGTAIIVTLYMLINISYLHVLGLEGMRQSDAVAADAMRLLVGARGTIVLALIISCAALCTLNGTIFTGARLYYSIGKELPLFGKIGRWDEARNTPVNAIVFQSAIALLLIGFGSTTRGAFQALVEYTAPVFWSFLLLTGLALFALRRDEAISGYVFRVPLYPLTPALFCVTCAYLLYSSVVYTGYGAVIGIGIVLAGVPIVWMNTQDD